MAFMLVIDKVCDVLLPVVQLRGAVVLRKKLDEAEGPMERPSGEETRK